MIVDLLSKQSNAYKLGHFYANILDKELGRDPKPAG